MHLENLPFDHDEYDMPMNVRPVTPDRIVQVDQDYLPELAEKRAILAKNPQYYCRALPGTQALQWEALLLLLPRLAASYPQWFTLTEDGDRRHWTNRLLGVEGTFLLVHRRHRPTEPGTGNRAPVAAVTAWHHQRERR